MTRPYSDDLRERVVASVSGGRSCRATAVLFGVGVATVVRWSQRHRATGSSAAFAMGGRRRLVLLPQREWLLARIAAAPDLTVRAVRAELQERGVKVSYGAVWSFLTPISLGLPHPIAQGLPRAADLAGHRADRRPLRRMLTTVLQHQAHRAFAHFSRKRRNSLLRHVGSQGAYRQLAAYPDARPVLEALRDAGIPRAILSNGEPSMLADAVAAAGIGSLLDAVLSVEQAGAFKPDPRVYRLATDRFGLPPAAVGFVSSNPWDAYGARVFGFRVFWINRAGLPDEYGLRGSVQESRHLSGLVAALD